MPIQICTVFTTWQINVAVISIYARGFFGRKASDGGCCMCIWRIVHGRAACWLVQISCGSRHLRQPCRQRDRAALTGPSRRLCATLCRKDARMCLQLMRSALLASLPRLTCLALVVLWPAEIGLANAGEYLGSTFGKQAGRGGGGKQLQGKGVAGELVFTVVIFSLMPCLLPHPPTQMAIIWATGLLAPAHVSFRLHPASNAALLVFCSPTPQHRWPSFGVWACWRRASPPQ